MASEDWILRLDPYNFDTEEEYYEFYYGEDNLNNNKVLENERD